MSNLMTDEEIIVARTTSVLRSSFRYFRKHVSYTRTYLIDTCICVRNTNIQLSVNAIFLSSCTLCYVSLQKLQGQDILAIKYHLFTSTLTLLALYWK